MKLNSKWCGWVLVAACIGLGACGGDEESTEDQEVTTTTTTTEIAPPETYKFTVSGECIAVREITQLDLVPGQTVEYCNKWNARAEIKFSVSGFLPGGALTMTLEPGECLSHVVDATVADGEYAWTLTCEGYTGPGGGGPVKVDDPPPGP